MKKSSQSYSEIYPFQLPFNNWREISLDIGASQSTLQDFKLAESSGFYCYKESDSWLSPTSNRFITWKICNDVVEFCEFSMDHNLIGNQVKLRFQNTPVLEGISVHETPNQVFILIATVASVHRLVLPHPRKLDNPFRGHHKTSQGIYGAKQLTLPDGQESFYKTSIFHNVSSENLRDSDSYHVLNNLYNMGTSSFGSSAMPFPITSCSWLTNLKEAVFVVANSIGTLMVIKMGSPGEPGKVSSRELKQVRMMERLWNGLIPSFIRGNHEGEDAAASIVSHSSPTGDDYFIFVLCRDLRIRVWSYLKQDCIIVHNVLESTYSSYLSANSNSGNPANAKTQQSRTVRRAILRKGITESADELYLGTFIGAVEHRLFVLYKLVFDESRYSLVTYATLTAPEEDIVDFCFTRDHIWTLWINAQSETSLRHCSIESSEEWQIIPAHNHLSAVYPQTVLVDPRELYITDIFWRGKFSVQAIVKAISILSRISESSFVGVKLHTLIEEATKIVENRIRTMMGANELSAEEYTELELSCWEKFYSYCVQYNDVGNKPLGILVDLKTSNVGILRKSCLSFMKANDIYDHFMLAVYCNHEVDMESVTDDVPVAHNLQSVVDCLKQFARNLTEEMLLAFEVAISSGEVAEKAATDIVNNYLLMATDITTPTGEPLKRSFDNIFSKAPHFLDVVDVILKALDLESKELQDLDLRSPTVQVIPTLTQLMSSSLGVSIICDTIKQMCRLRYNLCRDLLLFLTFVVEVRDKKSLGAEKLVKLRTHLIPMTAIYLQACYFMNWVCETPLRAVGAAAVGIEEIITQLSVLELNEYVGANIVHGDSEKEDATPRSILFYFILHNKCSVARRMVSAKLTSSEATNLEPLGAVVPLFIQSILQLLWPISPYMNLAEFLLGHAQYELVFQYTQLLDRWCQPNTYSRLFIKAFVHLALGETRKAVSLFQQSLFGITEEPFFQKLVQCPEEEMTFDVDVSESLPNSNQIFLFYMKLIQLFRLNCYWESVIELASQAILLLNSHEDQGCEEHRSSLLSTMFTCHLELDNIDEAYQAMMSNKNYMQRKDCLRQFIVDLSEKRKIQELITYTYSDMEEEFVNILESRARSSDLLTSKELNYYQVLYAYFVNNNNYRKAAACAYEYARRLCHEVPGLESLTKQAEFLSCAYNCLKIVNPKYAWVIKPTLKPLPSSTFEFSQLNASVNGKRKLEQKSEEANTSVDLNAAVRRVIEVLSVEDMYKEYHLTTFRLKLLQKSPKENAIANSPLSPQETLTLLIGNSMFDMAFRLCLLFKVPLESVFEGLVSKYVYLTQLVGNKLDETAAEIYDCFADNDTSAENYIGVADLKPVDKLWHLISAYLKMYEKGQQTFLHRSVAEKLLSSEIKLPSSLKISFQKRNCPELLRLLMSYNCIEEAVSLAIEYLEAFMGKGAEYFDIKSPLLPNSPPKYFPHQHYDCLLEILHTESEAAPEYKKMHAELTKGMDQFRKTEKQISIVTA